ncbi:MAG: diacylglycerol kinase family protein [Patescibacteria group bacterium]
MESKRDRKVWSLIRLKQSYANAFRGMKIFLATTPNLYIWLTFILLVVILGFLFHVSGLEWIALIFAISLIVVAEAFNTAIEIDIDLTSPEYHPYAKDTKDVAAAAVLLSIFFAIIVGIIVFLPKVIFLLS